MDRIFLVVTDQCNLSCAYCFQNRRKQLRVPSDVLRAGIDYALAGPASQAKIYFSGGEPLAEFARIREAVEYAETACPPGKRVRYWLSTNGLLLSEDIADFLEKNRFTIQLSFDGIALSQEHRGPHTFKVLDRRLDSLRTSHPDLFRKRLQISLTVFPPTVQNLADSIEYFLQKSVQKIGIAPAITASCDPEVSVIAKLDEQLDRISDISRRHLDSTGEVPAMILRKTHEDTLNNHQVDGLCGGLRLNTLVVDVDGQVYGCPFFAESYQKIHDGSFMMKLKALHMGDIRDPGLAERRVAAIQSAEQLVPPDWEGRRYSSYGKCCDCRFRTECFICPVSVWSKPDDTDQFRVPDFICAFNQVVLKYRKSFPCVPCTFEDLLPSDGSDPIEPLEAYLRSRQSTPSKLVET